MGASSPDKGGFLEFSTRGFLVTRTRTKPIGRTSEHLQPQPSPRSGLSRLVLAVRVCPSRTNCADSPCPGEGRPTDILTRSIQSPNGFGFQRLWPARHNATPCPIRCQDLIFLPLSIVEWVLRWQVAPGNPKRELGKSEVGTIMKLSLAAKRALHRPRLRSTACRNTVLPRLSVHRFDCMVPTSQKACAHGVSWVCVACL